MMLSKRCVASDKRPTERKGFFGSLVDNIKEEFTKSKEMKEHLKKFREERQKLEESDALKKAREKFVSINLIALLNIDSSCNFFMKLASN